MAAAEESTDWSLVNFAKQVFGAKPTPPEAAFNFVEPPPPEPPPAEEVATATVADAETIAAAENDSVPKPDQTTDAEDAVKADEIPVIAVAEAQNLPTPEAPQAAIEGKRQQRTASELADIILNALRAVDGVPERGFVITVYGARPWNAMLTIKPEAGRIKDAQLWRQRVQDIGARLRRDFDLIDER